jgi:methylmalonyl-CoA mutase N-terminal domain/subunit
MRQYAGFGSAEDTNRRFRLLLERGITGLSVAFDLPTQLGLDSDHPLAQGEVGRVGVAINHLDDLDLLFREIPLDEVSVSMTINATAPVLLALYLALARRRGVPWEKLRGTVQNDILKEYLARGTYIYPPVPSMRLTTDLIAFCVEEVPQWNPISVSGYHLREAGCTAAQELAFTMSHAEAYLEAAVAAGVPATEAARRFSFFFAVHNEFLEEVAKFRAARRLWSELLQTRFLVEDSRARALRFHAQTAGSTLTAQQPDNNLVRVTFQALAAVLGGAQSLHTNARDEAWSLPAPDSATLALRTQQILAYETGVTAVADPLGGSWCIERLTQDLVEEAAGLMGEIRSRGGVVAALESGFQQSLIEQGAYETQLAQESAELAVVGVNCFLQPEESPPSVARLDQDLERRRRAELRAWKTRRRRAVVEASLEEIRLTAQKAGNIMPVLLQVVEAGATVGEISGVLREVFGEHGEQPF